MMRYTIDAAEKHLKENGGLEALVAKKEVFRSHGEYSYIGEEAQVQKEIDRDEKVQEQSENVVMSRPGADEAPVSLQSSGSFLYSYSAGLLTRVKTAFNYGALDENDVNNVADEPLKQSVAAVDNTDDYSDSDNESDLYKAIESIPRCIIL